MLFNQLHWLEIAEYLSLALTVISIMIAIASQSLIYPIVLLSITLLLNLINRLRWQQLNRKRLGGAIKQLQRQFSEEIQALPAKEIIPSALPLPTPTESPINNSLPENLASFQESLNKVVQYLDNYAVAERIEQLEQSFKQLRREIIRLSHQVTDKEQISLPKSELSTAIPQPSLSSVNLPQVVLSKPNVPTWMPLHTLTSHSESVSALATSADGRFLASVSWDQTLKLWELATGKLIDTVVGHSQGLLTVVFKGDGTPSSPFYLATGSFDQNIKLWSLEAKENDNPRLILRQTLTAHQGSIHALASSSTQQILVSGSYDQTIKQWSWESGEMLHSSSDQRGVIYAIAVHENLIASAGGDGRVTLWQLGSREKLGCLVGNVSSVESLAISRDGQTLAAGCVDGKIKFWQLPIDGFSLDQQYQPTGMIAAHSGQVKSLVFSPDSQILFSSGADGRIKLWHPSSSEALVVLSITEQATERLSPVVAIALSKDGNLLAAGGVDGTIRIWQLSGD